MIFLIKHWRIIALVLAVLAALSALWAYGHTKYKEGYETAMSEVAVARAKADEQTRKAQAEIRKQSAQRKAKINDQNDDRPVGPLLQRYFDSLR